MGTELSTIDGSAICDNCGSVIGRLEIPWIKDEYILCPLCATRINQAELAAMELPADPFAGLGPPPQTYIYVQSSPDGSSQRRPRVQTIERTGKVWKAHLLLSSLCMIGGVTTAMIGFRLDLALPAFAGVFAFIVGIIWYAYARFMAWWHHG